MDIQLTEHRHAFTLATMLVPSAVWVIADSDIDHAALGDVWLEDKASGATLGLHADGTASFSHHRLVCVTPHFAGKA